MTKSRLRKNRKNRHVDASGKPITKKSSGRIRNAVIMRMFTLQDACRSLTTSEVEEIYNKAVERRDSTEKVKGPKPVLKYVTTKLDENQVTVDGETKEISISSADIHRLESIIKQKKEQYKKINEKLEAETNKTQE